MGTDKFFSSIPQVRKPEDIGPIAPKAPYMQGEDYLPFSDILEVSELLDGAIVISDEQKKEILETRHRIEHERECRGQHRTN